MLRNQEAPFTLGLLPNLEPHPRLAPVKRYTGLIAATFTPFHADGSLNLAGIEAQAQWLQLVGIRTVFINGTTGEGPSLSVEERKNVARQWCAIAREVDLDVLVHVGSESLQDCRELARHAQQIGASAISCFAPSYYKPYSVAELVAFCRRVAEAAPDLPFYYYHIPVRTGVTIAVSDLLREAAAQVPSLAGAKFSHPDLMDLLRCLRWDQGRFDILFGLDEMLLPAAALGVRGAVGTNYNYASGLYLRLLQAVAEGDLDRACELQHQANELIACLSRFGFLPAAKRVMAILGVDCGPVRPPLANLTAEQEKMLREHLERLGFPERFRGG